ncbi:MAG: toll/interleukin-1 receptor domain-containing protein [Lentisphaeria bacterium]|nr:toll/interleukin-1 receptor domain-containing protein [Lentisphaeria bacterium]
MNSKKKYVAFISYRHCGDSPLASAIRRHSLLSTLFCHDDMYWAIWLQKALLRYHLPTKLAKEHPQIPRKWLRIFRDETDLNSGVLSDELKKNLDQSNFIITICSPNSARPNKDGYNYVDLENQHFIQKSGTDRVIPVIIDGEPNAKAPEQECFPPVLRTKDGLMNGHKVKSMSRAFLLTKIVAKILDLDFNVLWKLERRRLILLRTLRSIALIFLLFCAWYAFDWYRPYTKYYADYVDRWGMPHGIFPLKQNQTLKREYHYRFIYQKRKSLFFGPRVLREVLCCNSAGYYREFDIGKEYFDRPVRQKLHYEDDFKLSSIDVVDRNGRLLEHRQFSGKDNTCIDFKYFDREGVSVAAFQRASGVGFRSVDILEGKTKIKRWRIDRDEHGYPAVVWFFENDSDVPAANADGFYGKGFEHDRFGRQTAEFFLDSKGNSTVRKDGIRSIRYLFEENASGLLGIEWLDDGDNVRQAFRYRLDNDRNICFESHYRDGKLAVIDGFAQVVNRFDDRGNCIGGTYFGPDGSVGLHEDGFATWKAFYDLRGNLVGQMFYGIDNKLCLDKCGTAVIRLKYDDRGNCIEESYYGVDGKPCLDKNGVASVKMTYDDSGNRIGESYYGVDGTPCLNKNGTAAVKMTYDDLGNLIQHEFYGVDSELRPDKNGIAVVAKYYDDRGNFTGEAYFGADEKLVLNKALGFACSSILYDDRGNFIEEAFFGTDEKLILSKALGAALVSRKFDERGICIEEAFFGTDEKLILSKKHGFALVSRKFDERGICIEEAFFGTDEKLILNKELGFARSSIRYDDRGYPIEQAFYGVNGELRPNKKLGYARTCWKYDALGNCTDAAYYDAAGKLWFNRQRGFASLKNQYDDRRKLIEQALYGADGKSCSGKDGFAVVKNLYDDRGNLIEQTLYDENGNPCIGKAGFASMKRWYDDRGKLIRTDTYGTDGKLCLGKDGFASLKNTFDDRGNLIEQSFYGVDGKPCLDKKGIARTKMKYDRWDKCIEWVGYGLDKDGNYVLLPGGE